MCISSRGAITTYLCTNDTMNTGTSKISSMVNDVQSICHFEVRKGHVEAFTFCTMPA
jgi:hypothetical protein